MSLFKAILTAALLTQSGAYANPPPTQTQAKTQETAPKVAVESPFSKKIQNPVGYDYMSTVKPGQVVYVRPLVKNQGQNHYEINAYQETKITRIWTGAPNLEPGELKPMDVEVEVKKGFDRVYHIAQLGLTQGAFSGYFSLGDTVIFPLKIESRTIHQVGYIVAILGGGDLLIKKGLNVVRVKAENLFSTNRNYLNSEFKIGEEITIKKFRKGSQIFTIEKAFVTAISPLGEIMVSTNADAGLTKLDPNDDRIIRLPKTCGSLFK